MTVLSLLVVSTPYAVHQHLVGMDSPGNVAGRIALGVVLVPVVLYLVSVFGGAHAVLARSLLCSEPLAGRPRQTAPTP